MLAAVRLAKFLSTAGVASRRAAEEIVRAGRVSVNGAAVTDPARDVTDADAVTVDGQPVHTASDRVVYILNKPVGVVSTASDPQRRPTVVSLIPSAHRLYPVGRLDIDTTGLILLTNDGDLAHRLTHPSFEVPRTYRARVTRPPVRDTALRQLRRGVTLDDGVTAPDVLEITIHEGRKRQVKRMCEAVGHPVRRLERIAFGPLTLNDLAPGAHRRLTPEEVTALSRAGTSARRAPARSYVGRGPRPGG